MHDSGARQQFDSGAVRDTAAGKPRPDLISPHAHTREGTWLALGAAKYAERNWEAGIPISRCIASLWRHLVAYQMGCTREDHMAAIRTNAGFILHNEEEVLAGRMDPAIADMPFYSQQYAPWAEDEEDEEASKPWNDLVEVLKTTMDLLPPINSLTLPPVTLPPTLPPSDSVRFYYKGKPVVGYPTTIAGPMPSTLPGYQPGSAWRDAEASQDKRESKWNIVTNAPAAIEKRRLANIDAITRTAELKLWGPAGLCEICKGRHPDTLGARVYIAGPMWGYAAYNAPAFDGAEKEWNQLGWIAINPIQLDRNHGVDLVNPLSDDALKVIIQRDLDTIMDLDPDKGDGLAVLPGWEKSTGARAEVALARWLDLPVWEATTGKVVK